MQIYIHDLAMNNSCFLFAFLRLMFEVCGEKELEKLHAKLWRNHIQNRGTLLCSALFIYWKSQSFKYRNKNAIATLTNTASVFFYNELNN